MKFSFDSEGYRNNLANELREQRATDKEGARRLLEEERATLQYKVSKDIEKVKQKIKEKRDEKGLETPQLIHNPEKVTSEEFRLEGSDGIEHLLEVQTIDISDQIPDELKLIYDIYRIAVIDSELSHLDIGIDKKIPVTKDPFLLLENFLHSELDDEFVERFWNAYGIFLDTITNGKISDPHFFMHIAGLWSKGYSTDLARYYPDRKKRIEKQYPHEAESGVEAEEVPLDVGLLRSDNLWFSRGGIGWDNYFNTTLLIDADNPRFQSEVKWYEGYDDHQTIPSEIRKREFETKTRLTQKQMTEIAIEYSDIKSPTGTNVQFKKEIPWLLIADQFVDPYHGRLIKVREKLPTEDIATAPSPE